MKKKKQKVCKTVISHKKRRVIVLRSEIEGYSPEVKAKLVDELYRHF